MVEPNEEFNARPYFRFECSVKFDEPGEIPVIVSHGHWRQAGWFLQKIGGRWRFHVDGVDCDGGSPKIGEWLHLVGVYDDSMLRLYENDKLVAECPAPIARTPWTQSLHIGQYSQIAPSFQFKGRIKDVRIW